VLEAQGALFFGSTEKLLRRLSEIASDADFVIVDFKRVHLADASARKLFERAAHAMAAGDVQLVFASIAADGGMSRLAQAFASESGGALARVS
jgi:glutaminase